MKARTGMIGAALLCAACSAAPSTAQESAVTTHSAACSVSGSDTGALPEVEICALFAPLLARHPGSSLAIAMPSNWRASAVLHSADGGRLASGGVSASDATIDRGSWMMLLAELERQLS